MRKFNQFNNDRPWIDAQDDGDYYATCAECDGVITYGEKIIRIPFPFNDVYLHPDCAAEYLYTHLSKFTEVAE